MRIRIFVSVRAAESNGRASVAVRMAHKPHTRTILNSTCAATNLKMNIVGCNFKIQFDIDIKYGQKREDVEAFDAAVTGRALLNIVISRLLLLRLFFISYSAVAAASAAAVVREWHLDIAQVLREEQQQHDRPDRWGFAVGIRLSHRLSVRPIIICIHRPPCPFINV